MGSKYKFIIDEEQEDIRLDKAVSNLVGTLVSRSFLQKLIKEELVYVNNIPRKASFHVSIGDEIAFELPDVMSPSIEPENIPLDILYEDMDVIVVNKPKDMVVHPSPGHYSATLVNALLYHCSDLSGINGVLRPGIVHRIDKDTTGSLIVCKNDYAHSCIACQLSEHTLSRTYRAICTGNIKEDSITIDAPIGRHPVDRKKMAVVENGRRAVTHVRVLERLKDCTYIECALETGRTHQIRVHMSHIGHPLLGDTVYSAGRISPRLSAVTCGQCLHAYKLGFIHPTTKEYVECIAPIPEYMEKLLKSKSTSLSG